MKSSAIVMSIAACLSISLSGCVTYEPPTASPTSDPTVVGIYEARYNEDGVSVVHEYTLFQDGYFEETVTYADEEEPFFDYGVYLVSDDGSAIEFYFIDPDSREYNFVAARDASDAFFGETDKFNRIGSQDDVLSQQEIATPVEGVYILSYEQEGEDVYYVMILHSDGSFIEWSIYMDNEEAFSDAGRFNRATGSGVTRFEYNDWPEGDFVGRVDGAGIYSVEGCYGRIDPDSSAEVQSLPVIVQNVLP